MTRGSCQLIYAANLTREVDGPKVCCAVSAPSHDSLGAKRNARSCSTRISPWPTWRASSVSRWA